MPEIIYPPFARNRGPGYWLRAGNLLAARRKLRLDYTNEWRYAFGEPRPLSRSVPVSSLFAPKPEDSYSIIILGDTGEGDRSQYGLLPLLRHLNADMMIINGDVAYPAGRSGSGNRNDDDFLAGFFEPYKDLGIPIWATPGNHEYYSEGEGRAFHSIFCTRIFDRTWSQHGLPHRVLQPGMYWELRDDDRNLVFIGLDSGKAANLDGHNDWWQFWKRRIGPDTQQHAWLDARLRRADRRGATVIVMFHIPSLVRGKDEGNWLSTVHQLIAAHPSVRLLLAGHEHNYQRYDAAEFGRYLDEHHDSMTMRCDYIVSGGGGAALHSTDYPDKPYRSVRYPAAADWPAFASFGRRVLGRVGRDRGAIAKIVGTLDRDSRTDADAARYLSFIHILSKPTNDPVRPWETVVTPVFMDNLKNLFDEAAIVDVMSDVNPIDKVKADNCLQHQFSITY
ncbi:MAG: hypothetical protein C0600_04745 [Ignavibacteria bacterium]|nr:MAG: hypothetical protein C0600_04745 [Ignavibacteria bacterium]